MEEEEKEMDASDFEIIGKEPLPQKKQKRVSVYTLT